ncbi:MAG TPA: hypothetical protein VF618_21010 [Thermoanaerobaculia bacterium]
MKRLIPMMAVALLSTFAGSLAAAEIEGVTLDMFPRSVVVTVTMPEGRPVKLTMKEGTMARLTRVEDGAMLAIAPIVLDEQAGIVKAQVFRVTTVNGAEKLTEIGAMELRRDPAPPELELQQKMRPVNADLLGMQLELQAIGTVAEPLPVNGRCSEAKSRPDVQVLKPCSQCCVTCDGWRFCGCAVEASCGSCCCIPCCG